MALKLDTRFPGQSTAGNANYPQGSARDVSAPGANNGTPLVADLVNDIYGLLQRLLDEAGIVPNGLPDTVPDSDYFDALDTLFSAAGLAPGVAALIVAQRNTWTKAQDVAQVTLADGATISTDASLSNSFKVTLGGNRTLSNPTNLVAGQVIVYTIVQDGTGTRTLTYGTLFKKPAGQTLTLSIAAGAKDVVTCHYDGVTLQCSIQRNFG